MKYLILTVLILLPITSQATIEEDVAVQCILGEARGEGYIGMLAVAEVLRKRGNTKGMYGCKAYIDPAEEEFLDRSGIVQKAYKAWYESETSNITNGATHFEGTKFITPYWAKDMIKTVKIGNQQFYKEIR